MSVTEAKKLIGQMCSVSWLDRKGNELTTYSLIHDVTFVPMYGGYLITDTDEVRLDRLTAVFLVSENGASECVFESDGYELPMAA